MPESIPDVTVTGQRLPTIEENESSYFREFWSSFVDYLTEPFFDPGGTQADASVLALPAIPELLPGVAVSGARIVQEATPLGIALSFFTPTPIVTQSMETAQLEAYYAQREAARKNQTTTPIVDPLPDSTVTPEVTQLPGVTVSPPAVQTKPRTESPAAIVPIFSTFAVPSFDNPVEQPWDEPIPEIIPIPEKEVKYPVPVAPGLGGSIPIGLPLPGGAIGIRNPSVAVPNLQVFDAASPAPLPDPFFIPFVPPSISNEPAARTPTIDVGNDLLSGLNASTDSAARSPGTTTRSGSFVDVPAGPLVDLTVPFADTIFSPELFAPPVPRGSQPSPFASPVPELGIEPFPFTAAVPQPLTDAREDDCDCSKTKKKRKPREPRTVCYKGTYRQTSKGIIYNRGEEVPCDAPPEKKKRVSKRETDPFGRPVPKRGKKRRTPTWQDTINDVFYPKP